MSYFLSGANAQSSLDVNTIIKRMPGFTPAVLALPSPFTRTQKARILRDPLAFFEEFINANRSMVLRFISATRNKIPRRPRSITVRDLVGGKTARANIYLTSRSDWKSLFIAWLALSNQYPAQLALSVPEVLANMVKETVTSWFGGFGELIIGSVIISDGAILAIGGAVATIIGSLAAAAGTIIFALTASAGNVVAVARGGKSQAELDAELALEKQRVSRENAKASAKERKLLLQRQREELAAKEAERLREESLQKQVSDQAVADKKALLIGGGLLLVASAVILKKKKG